MRILSQDGFYDVPYEAIAIRFSEDDGAVIIGVPLSLVAEDLVSEIPVITFGIYSTEVKARKAMEMLREEYTGMPNIRRMDDLYGRFKHTGKKDFELFIEHMVLKKCYFQFPADDEVEV